MPDNRIILSFPSDTIRLNGILQDTLSAIHCATSNLTYKEYMRISFTFLFVSEFVFANALKSLSARNEIYFDSTIAASYAKKNMENLSEEMVLTSLLIASIEKTLSLYSEFSFSTDAEFSSEKSFSKLKNELEFFVDMELAAEKSASYNSYIALDCAIRSTAAGKHLNPTETMLAVESAMNLILAKYSSIFISDAGFKTSAKFAVARFRKLTDIDRLTFADIDQWCMETFDMLVS